MRITVEDLSKHKELPAHAIKTLLMQQGFEPQRRQGSARHDKWTHYETSITVTLPRYDVFHVKYLRQLAGKLAELERWRRRQKEMPVRKEIPAYVSKYLPGGCRAERQGDLLIVTWDEHPEFLWKSLSGVESMNDFRSYFVTEMRIFAQRLQEYSDDIKGLLNELEKYYGFEVTRSGQEIRFVHPVYPINRTLYSRKQRFKAALEDIRDEADALYLERQYTIEELKACGYASVVSNPGTGPRGAGSITFSGHPGLPDVTLSTVGPLGFTTDAEFKRAQQALELAKQWKGVPSQGGAVGRY